MIFKFWPLHNTKWIQEIINRSWLITAKIQLLFIWQNTLLCGKMWPIRSYYSRQWLFVISRHLKNVWKFNLSWHTWNEKASSFNTHGMANPIPSQYTRDTRSETLLIYFLCGIINRISYNMNWYSNWWRDQKCIAPTPKRHPSWSCKLYRVFKCTWK
jgi:hypothetical protein